MSELPKGWAVVDLGVVVDSMKNGLYKPVGEYADDGVACLRMYNIQNGSVIWKQIKRIRLTSVEAEEYGLREGDLIVNRVNSRELVGKAAVIPGGLERCVFESKNIRVRVDKEVVSPDLVNYQFLQSGRSHFTDNNQQVVGMASISQPQVASFPIFLPPLTEQHRMVVAINALLTRVNACQQRLDRVPKLLARFRQSVLAAACSGNLTADWRSSNPDRSAKALRSEIAAIRAKVSPKRYREDYRAEVQENFVIPGGWEWTSLGNITSHVADVDHKMPKPCPGGMLYVSTKDFTPDGIDFELAKTISPVDFAALCRKIKPEKGDLLLSRYGTVGEVRRVSTDKQFQASYSIAIIKTLPVPFLTEWLHLWLRTINAKQQMTQAIRASGQPDLGLQSIRLLGLPLAPPEEQSEIIRRVDEMFAFAGRLEARVATARKRVEALTQSILAKAFRGELVPTEAELAEAEGREYETASMLLERVKANVNGAAPSKSPRATKRRA